MPERPPDARPEPKREGRRPPLPARILGRGARGAGQLADAAVEDAIVRAVESEAVERAVARVLEGPALDRAVKRALESPGVEQAWERVLASDEAQRLVERIAEAPEVRAAIAAQSAGLLEDLARQVRAVARRLDDALERVARRGVFRPRRSQPADRAGGVSRALALGLDAVILNASFFAASALVALAASVFLPDPDGVATPALVIGTGVWLAAAALYLIVFWSFAGQTPGMRFLGLVIHSHGSRRIGLRRAIRRLVGLVAGAVPLGLGFLGVLLGERRRGLADVFADTEVLYVEPPVREAPWS